MNNDDRAKIEMTPIGFVRRAAPDEDTRDRRLVCEIVLAEELAPALDGVEEWSHVYIVYWLDRVSYPDGPVLHFPSKEGQAPPVGVLATRSPIHPNPIGLTLVEIVGREGPVLQVRGLDAYDGTPVLDVKPYPDWEQGRLIVVTEFQIPGWLVRIIEGEDACA